MKGKSQCTKFNDGDYAQFFLDVSGFYSRGEGHNIQCIPFPAGQRNGFGVRDNISMLSRFRMSNSIPIGQVRSIAECMF